MATTEHESLTEEQLSAKQLELETVMEDVSNALTRMQLAYEDQGWEQIRGMGGRDFSRDGLRRNAELCRVMAIANPLIKRGLNIRSAYVWGQGIQVVARSQGAQGDQDVNQVVQDYLDDEGNRDAVYGAQARERWEHAQGTDGNRFFVCFTNPLTGRVQTRVIDPDQIMDIVTDPDDDSSPWLYLRQWSVDGIDPVTGNAVQETREAYYPALKYQPATRARTVKGVQVLWDSPVYHERVNSYGTLWGIGDAFAALSWSRAYTQFLEDWATLCKALSRFAFKKKGGKSLSQNMRSSLAANGAGGIADMDANTDFEAIPKTGATLDSESGRPLAAMVAAALGVTVTILLADPGTTGARAVAETLDLPMRLEMQGRQELHTETLQAILGYVVEQAVIAPRGPLKGTTVRDGDRLIAKFSDATDPTVEITWPDLDEEPLADLVKAITLADSTGVMPKLETLKLLLRALKVRDIDDILNGMTDDNGDFIDPTVNAGDAAVQRFRNGDDPGL